MPALLDEDVARKRYMQLAALESSLCVMHIILESLQLVLLYMD